MLWQEITWETRRRWEGDMKMVPRDIAEVCFIEGFSRPPWNRESLDWLHNCHSVRILCLGVMPLNFTTNNSIHKADTVYDSWFI
jgi:hypothetical protein